MAQNVVSFSFTTDYSFAVASLYFKEFEIILPYDFSRLYRGNKKFSSVYRQLQEPLSFASESNKV